MAGESWVTHHDGLMMAVALVNDEMMQILTLFYYLNITRCYIEYII